jgi:putative AbiEi antitoxin of type IV toxin-antitoxin system
MRPLDSKVERIATQNWGVVTRQELLAAGMSRDAIKRRLAKGALLREYPGVYRLGHRAPSIEATYMAAVKACGNGSLLAGRAAAYLYGLIKGKAPEPEVCTRTWRRIPGIITHRFRPRSSEYRGIPIAPVPDVLVQLAAVLDIDDLAGACHEARVRYGVKPRHVEAVLRPNAPGAGKLRAVIRGDARLLLSEMERLFFERLRAERLPLPETNRKEDGRYIDARWPDYGLTVELNSYMAHDSRYAWERDHIRAREAYARGDEFRSYTYRDVVEDPTLMLAELRQLLT